MIIYNDIFNWDGWGGVLRLASGQCRLLILDLRKVPGSGLTHLRPYVVVLEDLALEGRQRYGKMSVRSCCSHIATEVTGKFRLDPNRVQVMEYYPPKSYGEKGQYTVTERLEAVSLSWQDGRASNPHWKPPEAGLHRMVLDLVHQIRQGSS